MTIWHNHPGSYFLQNGARIRIWFITDLNKNYRCMIYTKWTFPFTHICIYVLCRFSDTRILMMSQRHCYPCDPQNHAWIFYNAWIIIFRFGTSFANFGFVMYQIQIIHVMIRFKHDVLCTVRLEASRATRIRHWVILVAPSCLRSDNAQYIMLKSSNRKLTSLARTIPPQKSM